MIEFALRLDGMAEKLIKFSEDELFEDGVEKAAAVAKEEIAEDWPSSPLTQDGRAPLNVTGRLKEACSDDAIVDPIPEGFELHAAEDMAIIASVQDKRYNIFTLSEKAQMAVANALEEGMLSD